ncbi:MAG: hypothetical protein U0936_24250 [Planctomycetaceae bacterium]
MYCQDLSRLATGELPFALVADLVDSVAKQDAAEKLGRETAIVRDVLSARDEAIVKTLRQEGVDEKTIRF